MWLITLHSKHSQGTPWTPAQIPHVQFPLFSSSTNEPIFASVRDGMGYSCCAPSLNMSGPTAMQITHLVINHTVSLAKSNICILLRQEEKRKILLEAWQCKPRTSRTHAGQPSLLSRENEMMDNQFVQETQHCCSYNNKMAAAAFMVPSMHITIVWIVTFLLVPLATLMQYLNFHNNIGRADCREDMHTL